MFTFETMIWIDQNNFFLDQIDPNLYDDDDYYILPITRSDLNHNFNICDNILI